MGRLESGARLGLVAWAMAVTMARAVRCPNDFAEAHWLVDYRFGFIRRGLAGSLYALPIVRLREEAALPRWCAQVRAQGLPLQVIGSSAHGERLHYDLDYRGPLALLLGPEREGLSEAARALCDAVVRLPMMGRVTSLNVAAAAAALAYEVVRQRHYAR
mgnify:CR=1 FL=1